jgi:Leucine rich repeat/BspA type Leucine rich repeat region (6 copies)
VPTSDLKTLTDLAIIEVRGSADHNLRVLFDEALPNIHYANFETAELMGSESLKRRTEPIDPSEHFDYVPNSEKADYNVAVEVQVEVEIVPYEVYLLEKQRAKMFSFYGWENLLVLRLHGCQFDELHWEMFDGLHELQHMSLEHNAIKVLPPFTFFGTPQLKTLSLARNEILEVQYRSFAGLLELHTLDLSENNLTRLSELTFPPFPKLEVMDLRENPIKFLFPATYGVMNNTKKLQLGAKTTEFELSAKVPFEHLGELVTLQISNLTASVVGQLTFQGLDSLESLEVQGRLGRIEFDAFSGTPKLRQLILHNCQIEDISMDTFLGVRQLETVDLSDNRLSYLPPGIFDDQPYLKEVYLQNNFLTELPKTFFLTPALRLVRLTNNPWVCTCEMTFWQQGITNAVRRRAVAANKCILDFQTGKKISCTTTGGDIYDYGFDIRQSPKCDGGPTDVQHRSVYYVMRKNLKCDYKMAVKRAKLRHQKILQLKSKVNAMWQKQADKVLFENVAKATMADAQEVDAVKAQRQKHYAKQFAHKFVKTAKAHSNDIYAQLLRNVDEKVPNEEDFNNILL